MLDRLSPPERAKLYSAYHAMSFIEEGMKLGLGTGSTAAWLVKLLGAKNHLDGLQIEAAATSSQTLELAQSVGLRMNSLDYFGWLDLTIDGADEFDPLLSLIKGGGGALLQEKIVANASEKMVVVTDPSKQVERLGAYPLPVEIVQFGSDTTRNIIDERINDLRGSACMSDWRLNSGDKFVTDEGHFLLDIHLKVIKNVDALSAALLAIPGVVETGLFIDMADAVVIGAASGEARIVYADEDEKIVDLENPHDFERLVARIDETGGFE